MKARRACGAHHLTVRATFSLSFIALVAALFARPAKARADNPFETTAGVTLNPIVGGYHESFNDKIALPPIPVPLLEVSQRLGPVEIAAYGLPALVAVPYTDAIQGQTSLRLSILNASLRLWDPGHHLAAQVGEIVYNQQTHYASSDFYANSDEIQYSRITGAHYGFITHLPYKNGFFEAEVNYAPVLLGTQVTTYGNGAPSRFDPERGEQIDGNLRFIHSISKRWQMIIGLRYVNFTAAYDVPGKPLSDRNCAFLPSFGYRFTTGP